MYYNQDMLPGIHRRAQRKAQLVLWTTALILAAVVFVIVSAATGAGPVKVVRQGPDTQRACSGPAQCHPQAGGGIAR